MEECDFEFEDIFEDDCFDRPKYLQKDTVDSQHRKSMALLHGERTALAQPSPGPLWRLQPPEDDPQLIKKKKTSLDVAHGTIYSMRREATIPSFKVQPLVLEYEQTQIPENTAKDVDILKMKEKSYIKRSYVYKDNERLEKTHFKSQILQDYKKPISDKKPANYGAPYDPLPALIKQVHDTTDDAVNSVVKPAKQPKVKTRKKQGPKRCRKPDVITCQFCDVLGPQTCSMCIEKTNRYIAKHVERNTLPKVDGSILTLVAPKLSKTMKMGDRMKNRMLEKSRLTKRSYSSDNLRHDITRSEKRTSFALPPITFHKSTNSLNLA